MRVLRRSFMHSLHCTFWICIVCMMTMMMICMWYTGKIVRLLPVYVCACVCVYVCLYKKIKFSRVYLMFWWFTETICDSYFKKKSGKINENVIFWLRLLLKSDFYIQRNHFYCWIYLKIRYFDEEVAFWSQISELILSKWLKIVQKMIFQGPNSR